jgi:23S rRNA G2445 N2-methylase RlmL
VRRAANSAIACADARAELMDESARYGDPAFTPARKELDAVIVALLQASDETAPAIERALGRAGVVAAERARQQLAEAGPAARVRLVRLIARVARENPERDLVAELCARLGDGDANVQRAAIIGLGKLKVPGIEATLLDYAAHGHALPEYRSLVEALGKAGGQPAADWLASQTSDDELTARIIERARLMLARTANRPAQAQNVQLDLDVERAQTLLLTCREGLESIVAEQVQALGETKVSHGRVCIYGFRGSLSQGLVARSALGVGFELPLAEAANNIDAVVGTLKCSGLLDWMQRSGGGTPRVRLSFAGQGHQRAAVWDLQTRLVREALPLVADPTAASWDIVVDLSQGWLDIMPKQFDDPRFSWRVAQLPSASHPTIAAALAHVAGATPEDVVWDPFIGSGLELVERARLGPYRAMFGTDIDERALEAARANLAAAQVKHVTLLLRDAATAPVRDVTLVITNPPLGARLVRDGTLGELLEATLAQGWRVLGPGGRWVWLSPMPAHTASFAHHLGFDVQRRGPVDVGGLKPELQILSVPSRKRTNATQPSTASRRRIVR